MAGRFCPFDVFGNIVNWPKDFFGNEFGEIAQMARAAMEKRRKASSS
jgi:hypothetical protein